MKSETLAGAAFRHFSIGFVVAALMGIGPVAVGNPIDVCIRGLANAGSALTWLYRAGSDRDRTFRYAHGVTVEERVSWFGLRRRIVVTQPDGSFVDFNRTDRSRQALLDALYYPEEFLDPASLRSKKVLDFGCGEGWLIDDLRRAGVDAHGLDIYLTASQRQKPYLTMADGTHTPYANETFDVLISTQSALTYLLKLSRTSEAGEREKLLEAASVALREMARITKKGGVLRLSPVPERRDPDGVRYPELEALIEAFAIPVRIRRRPDAAWLASTFFLESPDPRDEGARVPSRVWVELERL